MQFSTTYSDQATPINWIPRKAKITDEHGKTKFEMEVEAPDFWSDTAVSIVANKYFKVIDGVQETSVKGLVKRVVDKISEWGVDNQYFEGMGNPREAFESELTYFLTNQYAAFNTPVWLNFGVPNRPQTGSACFLLDVEDSLESIRDWWNLESKIFSAGAGAGVNISKLRAKGSPLSAGGFSSGPLSFMEAADAIAGAIKSGGTARRAAKLVLMDIEHSDIEEFIDCKVKEEKKARTLIEAGYSDAIDGEAYGTVSHQNANYSIRVSDDFMSQVESGDQDALILMDKIATAAYNCGDPGLVYKDNINQYYTIPNSGAALTGNPCLEVLSQPTFSACNLASINLLKFWDSGTKTFDWDKFEYCVRLFTIALDIICLCSEYPDMRIANNSINQHHIGLGFTNLGSLIMAQGLAYGSPDGRLVAQQVACSLTGNAFLASIEMAQELAPFPDYNKNKKEMLHVINKFKQNTESLNNENLNSLWSKVVERGTQFGFRNANTTVCAPAGTISWAMDCQTSGIEPCAVLVGYKKLVGGGQLKITNNSVLTALKYLDYTKEQINKIAGYIEQNETVENCSDLKVEHLPIFYTAIGKLAFSPDDHVNMLADVQKFICEGISKTTNLPSTATVEDIKQIYIKAWKLGIKAIAVYRDGSKGSQPINANKSESKVENKPVFIAPVRRRRLPEDRPAYTHKMDIAGWEGYIHAGVYEDGSPAELFIKGSKAGSSFSGLLDSIGILTSLALQHGVPLETIADKMIDMRFEPAGITKNNKIRFAHSILDYTFRWLIQRFSKSSEISITTNETMNGNGTTNGNGQLKPVVFENGSLTTGLEFTESGGVTISILSEQFCSKCEGVLIRTGTCLTCRGCGESVGSCG